MKPLRVSIAAAIVLVLCAAPIVWAQPVSGGIEHTALVKPDGTIWRWGYTVRLPTSMTSSSSMTAIAAGADHVVALASDGTVWTWGGNSYGELGDGTNNSSGTPVQAYGLSNIVAIAAGRDHSLALDSSGNVWGWGYNGEGQLGLGNTTTTSWPTMISSFTGVTKISAGWYHSLAVKSDGSAWAWGYNANGQLGDGTQTRRTSPVSMTGMSDAADIAGGAMFSLVLRSGGTVKSTGSNGLGSLGQGHTWDQTSLGNVSTLTDIVKIVGGTYHGLAINSAGDLYTWGYNAAGQVGDNSTTTRTAPVAITTIDDIDYVAAGDNHSLAIDEDGVVYAWGGNGQSQVGDGTTATRKIPTAISGEDYEWKAGTPYFQYAASGTAQLYDPINEVLTTATSGATIRYTTDGSEPTESSASVSSGGTVSVSQNLTLKAKAFKSGVPSSNTAVAVYTFIPQYPNFSPGGGTYTSAQNVSIWSNTSGVVFRYTTDGSTPTEASAQYTGPISVSTYTVLKAIATKTGWTSTDVTSATYTMNFGTLSAPTMTPGEGSHTSSVEVTLEAAAGATIYYTTNGSTPSESSNLYSAPITLTGTTTLKARAYRVDYTASSVTTATYTINAAAPTFSPTAGSYTAGQAITINTATTGATIRYTTNGAEPTETSASLAPGGTIIVGNYTLKAKTFKSGTTASTTTSAAYTTTTELGLRLAAGDYHSLAVQGDGLGWSWGRNNAGQLGDGTGTDRNAPVPILGSTGFVSLDGGEEHSVAVRSDGAVSAWGANGSGQLGNGSTSTSWIPVAVTGLSSGVVAVAAGARHSLALKSDGTVTAWGRNYEGQLGDGTTTDRTSPVAVSGLTGITAIAAGFSYSMALKGDGTVWTWGHNSDGQLGDGTTTQRTSPVQVSGITTAVAISAGASHAIAVLSDGTAKSWGLGSNGQLGTGTNGSSTTPVAMSGITSGVAAAAGMFHSLVLSSNGSVRAFGYNNFGQLGDGTQTDRWGGVTPLGLPAVEYIAIGTYHSLAMTTDGVVYAWGYNWYGSLGDRTNTMRMQPVAISTADLTWSLPAPIFNTQSGLFYNTFNVTVTSPETGATIRYTTDGSDPTASSSTVTSGGTVSIPQSLTLKASAWLTGTPTSHVTSAAYVLKAVTPVLSPATGAYGSSQSVSMSTTTSGATIRYTLDGSEPTTSSTTYSTAISVANTQTVKATAFKAGWTNSDSGFASYWISAGTTAAPSFSPAAGTYTTAQLVTITSATGGSSIRYTLDGSTPIATSPLYTYPFIVDSTTTVKAMAFKAGYTASSVTSVTYSVDVSTAAETPTLTPGGGRYTTNQTVTVTGATGTTLRYTTDGTTPDESDTTITSGNTITIDRSTVLKVRAWKTGVTPSVVRRADYLITGAIAAGEFHGSALKSNGTVWVWGRAGGVVDGNGGDSVTPIQILTGAVAIAGGTHRGSAVKSDGTVWAWGTGAGTGVAAVQVTATGFTGLISSAVGTDHHLALKSDGTVWAWGDNAYGQLGIGTTTNQSTPVQVTGLSGVTAIAAGRHISFAVGSDGASNGVLWAWGRNDDGELGDGSTLTRTRPVMVGTLSSVVAVAAGGFGFAAALKSDGTVWTWGSNANGALGRAGSSSGIPQRVHPLEGIVQISAGWKHVLALDSRGRVWAWGNNENAALGNFNYYPYGPAWFPQPVLSLGTAMAVAAGGSHSNALLADGSVWSWGSGKGLGDGAGGISVVPIDASDLVLATNTLLSGDADGDGLIGWREYLTGSDPVTADTNGNGVLDGVESEQTTTDPDNPDTDGDGLVNWLELKAGTDPFDVDSDDDTVNDQADAFPLDPARTSMPSGNPSDTTPPVITLTEPTNATLVP